MLAGSERARLAIYHTERTQRASAHRPQRRSGVEADVRLAGDQRIVIKARVFLASMGAEGHIAAGF